MSNELTISNAIVLETATWVKTTNSGKKIELGLAGVITKGTKEQREDVAMRALHSAANNNNWKAVMVDVIRVFSPSTLKVKGFTMYDKASGTLRFIEKMEDGREMLTPLDAGTNITKSIAMLYFAAVAEMADEKLLANKPFKAEKAMYAEFAKNRLSIEAQRKAELARQQAIV